MLDVPEIVKQRCEGDNAGKKTAKCLELSFFNGNIDALYPSNDLYPAGNLYPADLGTPWLTIGMDKIGAGSMNLKENLCSGSNLIWGSCEASKFEIIVADTEDEIIHKEFAATLSIGDYKMAYGIYRVNSVVRQADRRKRKITAYDRMVKFDIDVADWYKAMYPTKDAAHTIRELRDGLCEYIGVPQQQTELVNDGLVAGRTISPESLSGREVLKSICEINGVFGHFDRTGRLTYIRLQGMNQLPDEASLQPGVAENLDHYKSISYEDYLIDGIDRVQIRQQEGDIGAVAGSGSNAYVIEGNFLAYGLGNADLTKLAQSIYDVIAGKPYRPAKITTYAMPWVEVGDGLRAVTRDAEVVTYVLSRTMSGIQAMMDAVEAKGAKAQKQGSGLMHDVIQLKGRAAVLVRNVEELSSTLTDLEKEAGSRFEQFVDAIRLKVDVGDVSSQLSLEKGEVRIVGNRLIIDSDNLKLDADAAIFSGLIQGAEIDIRRGGNVGLRAAGGKIQMGDFVVSDAYGRQILQSTDERTGMSGEPNAAGRFYLWAGYKSDSDYAFAVNNRKQAHAHQLYCHDDDDFYQGRTVTDMLKELSGTGTPERLTASKPKVYDRESDAAMLRGTVTRVEVE